MKNAIKMSLKGVNNENNNLMIIHYNKMITKNNNLLFTSCALLKSFT